MFKDPFAYDWPEQQKKWQNLLDLPLTPENKQTWMDLWDDLERNFAEQKARLHWDSMADVESPEPLERFKHFNQEVVPQVMGFQRQIYQRWVAFSEEHPTPGWEVTTRYLKHLQHEQQTIPDLLQQEEQLIMEYYNTSHLEQPVPPPYEDLQDLLDSMLSPDAQERQRAWTARQIYMKPVRAHRSEKYLELIHLRWKQARNLGFEHPLAMAWERLKRHDFTLQQWQQTRSVLLQRVPALHGELQQKLADLLGIPAFKVTDTGHPALSQASTLYDRTDLKALHQGLEKMFQAFSPLLADRYCELLEKGYLDLEDRRTKTTQAFADLLPVTHKACAMLMMDAQMGSLSMLWHELGHVFHFSEMVGRHHAMQLEPSYKFLEFVAHAFEVLGACFVAESGLLSPEKVQLLQLLTLLSRSEGMLICSIIDLWEEWVYTTPPEQLTLEALYGHWERLLQTHAPWFLGVREYGMNYWTAGWHVRVPLGMTRYALADLCVAEFSDQMLADPHQAFARLTTGMQLGGTKPFLELIRACGLQFDFSPESVERELQQFERLAAGWGYPLHKNPSSAVL